MKSKKESVVVYCKIKKEISDLLAQFCDETGMSKTAAVENAIKLYYERYSKTGKIN